MLLVPHVLVSVAGLVEGEDFFVDDGLDVVCFDGAVHLLELQPAAYEDAADGADVVLGVGWSVFCFGCLGTFLGAKSWG